MRKSGELTYIKGYVLVKEYPGSKTLGFYEPYTTGELSMYPEFWKPVRSDDEVGKVFAAEITKMKGEIGLLREKDLDIYDVWEAPNNNLFIKMTEEYSLAIGTMGQHAPGSPTERLYVKANDIVKVKKVGKIIFE